MKWHPVSLPFEMFNYSNLRAPLIELLYYHFFCNPVTFACFWSLARGHSKRGYGNEFSIALSKHFLGPNTFCCEPHTVFTFIGKWRSQNFSKCTVWFSYFLECGPCSSSASQFAVWMSFPQKNRFWISNLKLERSQKALRCHFELPRVEINRLYRWPLSFYPLFTGPYLKHSICRIVVSLLCLSVCSSFSSTCRRMILSIGQSVLSVPVPTVTWLPLPISALCYAVCQGPRSLKALYRSRLGIWSLL